MIEEIKGLKKERDAIILAHNYQLPEIQDVADFAGDSLDLAKKGAETGHRTIVFCGVRFMAESAKILAPEKTVLLPVADAGCPMADMVDREKFEEMKRKYPDAAIVCYVNTTAETKANCDYCCTSANAVSVIEAVDAKRIIFVPDENLASWVQRHTRKEIIPYPGYCYVHKKIRSSEVKRIKEKHPDAELLIHPEADPDLLDLADHVLSTNGMVKYVKGSACKKFIIGTEEGLIYRLKKENPKKEFYAAGNGLTCINMKKTRLADVVNALKNNTFEIKLDPDIMDKARQSLQRMINIRRSDG
ncbi:MAG TPA: quinolinate synthase NadA [bacterium (Candidatus Stahlbacteria)]|nr:quinolinate synthase NadA [Candidatus Stahlbacteria bacterium]